MRVFAHRFFLLTLACMLCLGASAKKKEKGVYLFGYGTALLPAAGRRSFGMTLLGGYLAYALAGLPLAAALKPAGDRRQERAGIC